MVVLSLAAAEAAEAAVVPVKKIEEEIALLAAEVAVVVPELMLVKAAVLPVEVVALEVVLMVEQVALLVVAMVEMVEIMEVKQSLEEVEMVAVMVKMGSKDKTFIMTQSGHIAGIVNPPSKKKYGHYVNDDLELAHEDWLQEAEFHEGSWWPRWGKWLKKRSGAQVDARFPGDDGQEILGDAPGDYVKRKAND